MATYKFWKKTGGAVAQVGTGVMTSFINQPVTLRADNDLNIIELDCENLHFDRVISLADNLIEIEGVSAVGTAQQIADRLRDEVFIKAGGSAQTTYQRFSAIISQSLTANPTWVIQENTFAGVPNATWSIVRTAAGTYDITGPAFPANKTFIVHPGSNQAGTYVRVSRNSPTVVGIWQGTFAGAAQDTLVELSLEIRVYP